MKKTWKLHGRREPYTVEGIGRLPCYRCGAPAYASWQICADHRLYRPLCKGCDVAMNAMVLEFVRIPRDQRRQMMKVYKEAMQQA